MKLTLPAAVPCWKLPLSAIDDHAMELIAQTLLATALCILHFWHAVPREASITIRGLHIAGVAPCPVAEEGEVPVLSFAISPVAGCIGSM